jgi:hypothetical protein
MFLGPDEPNADWHALKDKVTQSKVFSDKVTASCTQAPEDKKSACTALATDKLFCELLKRSEAPAMQAAFKEAQCESEYENLPAPPSGSFAAVKASIVKSAGFKKQSAGIAAALGCQGVKKTENCDSYVSDAAFCLAFADKLHKFENMQGAKDEVEHCKHIDEKMPQLSLLNLQGEGFMPEFIQMSSAKAPEDELAKEMTHDLEMNFNKIAPFGKEDTAKELQDHAAKTQDTLVDAVENAEVAEIKRAVFRALTRLRAATIKEFDTIARLETQAIDAYNDAHHYRAENPLTHLHEDEAPVETDKLKSFH